MNSKFIFICIGLVVLIGAILFFFPGVAYLLGTLISGVKNQANSQTSLLTTGQQIKIEKKVTPYEDWNTGSRREKTEIKLSLQGNSFDDNKLKELVNEKNPGTLTFPSIWDAVEMKPDDVLIVVSKDSQGTGYVVIRLQFDQSTGRSQADVVSLDGKESQHNWFPESRLVGWTRAINTDGRQFLIQHSPFKVVSLGDGDLAKVDFPYAFMADATRDQSEVFFRVVDLVSGKEISRLSLDGQCFSLPRFSFDHPKLDGLDSSESDEQVKFLYGPKWWDKNIDFKDSKLELKPDHVLAAPAQKVLSITYDPREYSIEKLSATEDSATPAFGGHEIDNLPRISKSCEKINPVGFEKAKKLSATVESVSVAEFCLAGGFDVNPEIRKKVCGPITRKQAFAKNGVVVNQVSFTYNPLKKDAKPITINSPELEIKGKKYLSLPGKPGYGEILNLKEFFILNPTQILFKARAAGPWHLYLVTAEDTGPQIQKVGEYAFPGSAFENAEDSQYMYMRNSGGIVRKNPFGYIDFVKGLATITADQAVTFFIEESKQSLHLNLSKFTTAPFMEQSYIWSGRIALKCFAKDELPTAEMTLHQREQWFKKYFNWQPGATQIQLKQSLNGHSGCTIETVKD